MELEIEWENYFRKNHELEQWIKVLS